MQAEHRANIDSLRRSPTDGAYHCPKCNAPFTRRSNLRRHFHIHTRNVELRCPSCNKLFFKNDELQLHYSQCSDKVWDASAEQILQDMVKFDSSNGLNQPVDLMNSLGFSGMGQRDDCVPQLHGNFTSDFESYPTLDPSAMYHQEPQEFKDFLSSLSSMSDGSNSSPSPTTFGDSSPPFNTLRRRPSSSASSTSSASISSPSFLPPGYVHTPDIRVPSRLNPSPRYNLTKHGTALSRGQEAPAYSRHQVEDMLGVVNNCFIDTIDAILQRTNTAGGLLDPESPLVQASLRNIELRRVVLSEALPRLLQGLENSETPFGNSNPSV